MDALKDPCADCGDEKGGERVLVASHAKGSAAGHGGLFRVLPSALQRATVSYLCADDVADVELVSKGGRELCKAHFETLRHFQAKGMAALSLMLRHSRQLRSFSIPHLSPTRRRRLLVEPMCNSVVEHFVVLRNCKTLIAAPRGTSADALSRCGQLQSLPGILFGHQLDLWKGCKSLRALNLMHNFVSPELTARLLAVRPLSSLTLNSCLTAHVQAVVSAGAGALSALAELSIAMRATKIERAWPAINELLALVKGSLTSLKLSEASADATESEDDDRDLKQEPAVHRWDLPALRRLELEAFVRPKLTAPCLDEFRASFVPQLPLIEQAATTALEGRPAFPRLTRLCAKVSRGCLPGLTSVLHLDLSEGILGESGRTQDLGLRYLLFAMPQLETLRTARYHCARAERGRCDLVLEALLRTFAGRPLEHHRLHRFRGGGLFGEYYLPALAHATIDHIQLPSLLASAPNLRTLIVDCGSDGFEAGYVAAALEAVAAVKDSRLLRLVVSDHVCDEEPAPSNQEREQRFGKLLLELRVFERCRLLGHAAARFSSSLPIDASEFALLEAEDSREREDEFDCDCEFRFDKATGALLPRKPPRD